MLCEAKIVVPEYASNFPLEPVLDWITHHMTVAFGGCTVYDAIGSWHDDEAGEIVKEPVWVVVTAYDPENKDGDKTMEMAAQYVRRVGQQKSVYIRLASGEVKFIEAETRLTTEESIP